ncbi:MAG TPA: FliM/FliN family flagellar motor switch protein [Candidatus Baltobacteraceae bacterium]|nr:FliM/FliN family flagellar motor switch protein [Candidatus Baltobacteraceae bacterium]
MIADATFGPRRSRVRRLRFVPRSSIPLSAACLVANGIRETLRELLGEPCEIVLGEPARIGAEAWRLLAADALLYLTRGRQTDVVIVLPRADARRLVLRAFGEGESLPEGACSALELHALERIAARCAAACDPLCAERHGGSRPVQPHEAPPCVAYVDLRVRAPVPLTLGIAIARDLPDPGPAGALAPAALDPVPLEARAVFAEGTMDAAAIVALRPGDVVKLATKVGAPAHLTVAAQPVARGTAGAAGGRAAFLVHDVVGATHP